MKPIAYLNGDMVSVGYSSLPRFHVFQSCCVSLPADFRPSYTKLSYFKIHFPEVPILALTATATARVEHDIVVQLGLRSCLLFRSSFNRPNLRYEVRKKARADRAVEEMGDLILKRFTTTLGGTEKLQCGIVYCATVQLCEVVAQELENKLEGRLGKTRRKRVK